MTQLALFDDPPPTSEPPEVDLVDALLATNEGDPRATIRELLLDADFLRDQLYMASCMMSNGMGRGWRPKYERVSS